ncbi:MAG: hypothetical protein IIV71_04375, partial [Bacteroidaceae bacterium]|nr:hypothetical protein [Bacteroidaceae bacterium]
MVLVAMPLTSCDDDDEPINDPSKVEDPHDPTSDADQVAVKVFDALEYLQGCLVVVDKNGEVVRNVYGTVLDESQPTVISVPVADYAAAEATFLGWVAPGKKATKVEGGYDYQLTDAHGNAQGSVSFRAATGKDGLVALMSVAPGTNLKQVSEVRFIDSDLWPENIRYSSYTKGNVYILDDYSLRWTTDVTIWETLLGAETEWDFQGRDYQQMPFYCIQGNTHGEEAILIWLSPDENDVAAHPYVDDYVNPEAYKYLPTVAEAQKVLDIFNDDIRFWNKMLAEMDKRNLRWSWKYGVWTTGNDEFLLNEYNSEKRLIKCLDLDQNDEDDELGRICDVKLDDYYRYRYLRVRIFPPAN